MSNEKNTSFPVWILAGRDANTYRKGNKHKIKYRPWKAASFSTKAEADACKVGIGVAIGAMLNNVVFIEETEAHEIDVVVCKELRILYPEIRLVPIGKEK